MGGFENATKIERLPKWAQAYIARLESSITHLEKERAEMTGDTSPIWHTPDYQTKLHLPKRTTVVFKLASGEVEFSLRNGDIHVLSNNRGGSRLFIMPDISNGFTIGVEEL